MKTSMESLRIISTLAVGLLVTPLGVYTALAIAAGAWLTLGSVFWTATQWGSSEPEEDNGAVAVMLVVLATIDVVSVVAVVAAGHVLMGWWVSQ